MTRLTPEQLDANNRFAELEKRIADLYQKLMEAKDKDQAWAIVEMLQSYESESEDILDDHPWIISGPIQ